jgi:hypothetical protein
MQDSASPLHNASSSEAACPCVGPNGSCLHRRARREPQIHDNVDVDVPQQHSNQSDTDSMTDNNGDYSDPEVVDLCYPRAPDGGHLDDSDGTDSDMTDDHASDDEGNSEVVDLLDLVEEHIGYEIADHKHRITKSREYRRKGVMDAEFQLHRANQIANMEATVTVPTLHTIYTYTCRRARRSVDLTLSFIFQRTLCVDGHVT